MVKVLITDDAAFMRTTLKAMIVDAGYEVVAEAENGLEAVELYKKHRPDLVTMDYTMPIMNGIEALKKIKEFDANAKVVMCSAVAQPNIISDAIQYGAVDFIKKPFNAFQIQDTLNKIV